MGISAPEMTGGLDRRAALRLPAPGFRPAPVRRRMAMRNDGIAVRAAEGQIAALQERRYVPPPGWRYLLRIWPDGGLAELEIEHRSVDSVTASEHYGESASFRLLVGGSDDRGVIDALASLTLDPHAAGYDGEVEQALFRHGVGPWTEACGEPDVDCGCGADDDSPDDCVCGPPVD